MAVGVSGALAPNIYQQPTAPTAATVLVGSQIYAIPEIDDLWVDTTANLLKRCTSVSPFTWVSIEGGGSVPNFSDEETPSGAINSSNKTFTLAFAPSPGASLLLHLNGLVLQQGSGKDYTLSGSTITFTNAPATGDLLLAWYRH